MIKVSRYWRVLREQHTRFLVYSNGREVSSRPARREGADVKVKKSFVKETDEFLDCMVSDHGETQNRS